MKIKLTKEQEDLLSSATVIQEGDNFWYYFPWWIKKDKNGNFESIGFNHLPNELKEIIIKKRMQNET